jgi:hypothetical protein
MSQELDNLLKELFNLYKRQEYLEIQQEDLYPMVIG